MDGCDKDEKYRDFGGHLGPKRAQMASKWVPEGPKRAPNGLKWGHCGPQVNKNQGKIKKMCGGIEGSDKWDKYWILDPFKSIWAPKGLNGLKMASKRPKKAQKGPKWPNLGHTTLGSVLGESLSFLTTQFSAQIRALS